MTLLLEQPTKIWLATCDESGCAERTDSNTELNLHGLGWRWKITSDRYRFFCPTHA